MNAIVIVRANGNNPRRRPKPRLQPRREIRSDLAIASNAKVETSVAGMAK